jgi:macrolide transport system ATP-binding/permease protein
MENLFQDLSYGVRMLLKNPGFTLVAIVTLALGIGANTAIFSFVDSLLVRDLPVREPTQLVSVNSRGLMGDQIANNTSFSYPLYSDYRDHNEVLEGLAAYGLSSVNLTEGGASERILGVIVSGNYFDVLGISMAKGRTFLPEEDQTEGTHPVVVLSHGFWGRRFGADPQLLNREIELNGHSFTVIGITPPEFTGTVRGTIPDIYIPIMMRAQAQPRFPGSLDRRNFTWISLFGRLKPGIHREQAEASLTALTQEIARVHPENIFPEILLSDYSKGNTVTIDKELSLPLWLLMGTVALVLLIACANVANLLLARAITRRKEIAVRLALGAGRVRLIRQLLTESLLLSVMGGGLGLLIALWLADLLISFRPPSNILNFESHLDWRVLGFSALLTILTGIIFGLAPAIQHTKPNLAVALKDETGTRNQGRKRFTLRSALVVVQIALSLVVLIGAGLCVRSLQNLQSTDLGFEPSKLLVLSLDLASKNYQEAQGREFQTQLLEGVSTLPGVEAASLARVVPLSNAGMSISLDVEGYTPPPNQFINFDMNLVGPHYFTTMKMPLVAGREFGEQDTATSDKVVLINETAARTYWPGENALGKHLLVGTPGSKAGPKRLEIIGIVKDSKYRNITEAPRTIMFLPAVQNYFPDLSLHVRGANPKALTAAVQRVVQGLDANLPVFGIRTLEEQRSNSLYIERMAATLLSAFGILALLLAGIGIYGVMAYLVNQRRREIGIRLAIGAEPGDIIWLILKQGLWLVAIGVAIGGSGAFAVTRLLANFLFGISPVDTFTFIMVAIVLTGMALVACLVPARRATKVDPMVALRYE